MRFLIIFALLLPSFVLSQAKYLAVMGAGGEPKNVGTIFDEGLSLVGEFSKKNPDYLVDLHFNGGHLQTESIAREKFKKFDKSNYFTAEAFERSIAFYEDQISSGKIKSNDQILIHINTHGSEKDQETHKISTLGEAISNYNTLGSSSSVSLDRLKKLTELAEKKGVKLAIIDLSCHSGNTLSLANSKTCVISGTGLNHFGFGGSYEKNFSNRFNRLLNKGKNLEEIFIEARANHHDISYPMISSPQGKEIQSKLYEALTPFIYFHLEKADKFIPFIEEDFLKGKECKMPDQFALLISESQKILLAVKDENTKQNIKEFQAALKAYYDYFNDLKYQMNLAGFGNMKKRLNFCSEIKADPQNGIKEGKECINYFTLEMLMGIDFNNVFKFYEEKEKSGTPEEKAHNRAIIKCYQKAQDWKNFLIKENPHYAEISNFWKKLPQLQAKTQDLARAVNQSQQKLYVDLYQRSRATGANPCRDFVL